MCMGLLLMYICARRGRQIPGTGVTDSCELPCGCWELNPGPLEEQPVLLTAEPSPQLLHSSFWESFSFFSLNLESLFWLVSPWDPLSPRLCLLLQVWAFASCGEPCSGTRASSTVLSSQINSTGQAHGDCCLTQKFLILPHGLCLIEN